MVDLVYDKDGKAYAKAHRTSAQQAEADAKHRSYLDWAEAKMRGTFKGTLAEFRTAQEPASVDQLTVKQLRMLARERGIRGRSKMRKAELIAAISPPLLRAMRGAA